MANRTLTAFDRVKIARDPKRPHVSDFIANICSDFEELHGDRLVNDDRGLIAGFATISSVSLSHPHLFEAFKALVCPVIND